MEDFSSLTVAELKERLREAGLPVSGSKTELITRLQGDGYIVCEDEGEQVDSSSPLLTGRVSAAIPDRIFNEETDTWGYFAIGFFIPTFFLFSPILVAITDLDDAALFVCCGFWVSSILGSIIYGYSIGVPAIAKGALSHVGVLLLLVGACTGVFLFGAVLGG